MYFGPFIQIFHHLIITLCLTHDSAYCVALRNSIGFVRMPTHL